MPKSIVVLGAGPGLGQAVARRYGPEGHTVVLVGRRTEKLQQLAEHLAAAGVRAHAVTADLSATASVPHLADQVRALVGDPDVIYYGAAPNGFIPVLELTPDHVRGLLPLAVDTPIALVREFLPAMIERGSGAILSAQGASAVHGNPSVAGALAMAAQRNYLQALHAQVRDRGVYVGGLYIGAAIEHTPFHARMLAARAAGSPGPELPSVDPARLADVLWSMHASAEHAEVVYPSDGRTA
jgi:NAD(P)-dependent dehydrogenase (short-subunit alcohol dehydrogenase family)